MESASELEPIHYACAFRSVTGSVAHLKGLCSCFIYGSAEGDPPGLTLHEAALAAYVYWQGLTEDQREEALTRPKLPEGEPYG